MSIVRIALANIRPAATPDESITLVRDAITSTSAAGAAIVCFPEAYVPGYRTPGRPVPPPNAAFLERAWADVSAEARARNVAVVLGTERIVDGALRISALVFDRDGSRLGVQDKVQLDPSEDTTYTPAAERSVFHVGDLTFGVAICHEGWRYPET